MIVTYFTREWITCITCYCSSESKSGMVGNECDTYLQTRLLGLFVILTGAAAEATDKRHCCVEVAAEAVSHCATVWQSVRGIVSHQQSGTPRHTSLTHSRFNTTLQPLSLWMMYPPPSLTSYYNQPHELLLLYWTLMTDPFSMMTLMGLYAKQMHH